MPPPSGWARACCETMRKLQDQCSDPSAETTGIMAECFRWFVVLSLSLAALLKLGTVLSSAVASAPSLGYAEPLLLFIFGTRIPMWAAMLLEALGETAVVVLVIGSDLRTRMSVTAFVSTLFLIYHLLLVEIGYRGPCPCFGNAYKWLGLGFDVVNAITLCVALLMATGSYGWFVVGWLKGQRRVSGQRV